MNHPVNQLFFTDVHSLYLLLINPQATTILAILILVLLILSFIVSGAEIAFFSLNHKDINILKTKQDASWKRIVNLLEDPRNLQASILLSNTFINISIIIVSNFLIDQVFLINQNFWLEFPVKVALVTFVLVLFGEIMPKIWASQNNLQFAYYTSGIIEIIHLLFSRVSRWMVRRSDKLERLLGSKRSAHYTSEEIDDAINRSADNNATEEEKNILKGIVKFGNITVKQIMKTRLEVNGVDSSIDFEALKHRVEELHYSRLPVYKESLDNIQGMVHTKDLLPYLHESASFDWRSLLRPPYFVHEQKLIDDLLKEFQSKRIHFAIVVDEFGGTSGIVTLEDVLEEIIGDIRDEFDEEESTNRKLDDNTYVFEGRTMINDVCRIMMLPADTFDSVKGQSDSLAGLVLEIAGNIPKVNDVIPCGEFEFTVLDTDRSRLKKLKVSVNRKQVP